MTNTVFLSFVDVSFESQKFDFIWNSHRSQTFLWGHEEGLSGGEIERTGILYKLHVSTEMPIKA